MWGWLAAFCSSSAGSYIAPNAAYNTVAYEYRPQWPWEVNATFALVNLGVPDLMGPLVVRRRHPTVGYRLRSTSPSCVAQETLIRIAVCPCQTVPPHQAVPSF
jgi:hypothetical protein